MTKIVRTVKHIRGPFGKFIKWIFIIFNFLMLFWLLSYWTSIAPMIGSGSEAEQAGAAMGSVLGTGLVISMWGMGAVILGISVALTRGKRIEIEETVVEIEETTRASVQKSAEPTPAKSVMYLKEFPGGKFGGALAPFSQPLLQYLGFLLFLLIGLGDALINLHLIPGYLTIIAGALLLPAVQKRLVNTPLNTPKALTIAVVGLFAISIYLSINARTDEGQERGSNDAIAAREDDIANAQMDCILSHLPFAYPELALASYPTSRHCKEYAELTGDKKVMVAVEATEKYEIAKKVGEKMDACIQAGLVAAAYLQAQDESAYSTWKTTEHRSCEEAGVPNR